MAHFFVENLGGVILFHTNAKISSSIKYHPEIGLIGISYYTALDALRTCSLLLALNIPDCIR